MIRRLTFLLVFTLCGCRTATEVRGARDEVGPRVERVVVAAGGRGLMLAESNKPFHPWGMNYGNAGRLMEDFWNTDWETIAGDLRELKVLGANVVRVHLQFGKFMDTPGQPNARALRRLQKMLKLAGVTGLYLDITGLACYRPEDTPAWYDALNEPARWAAQAKFWEAVAAIGAPNSAVFCYDLMNEPVSPAERRMAGQWRSGHLFGGYDFIQYIALDPAGRTREEIVRQWIERMIAAIRRHDTNALITVGLLPWSQQWKHLSGFVPERIAPQLDFISVHIYPDKARPGEAMESLRVCAVGKPVVIEETFPLSCDVSQLETFLRASREVACGWLGHYDGQPLEELDTLERSSKLTIPQAVYREWLRLFTRLKPEFSP